MSTRNVLLLVLAGVALMTAIVWAMFGTTISAFTDRIQRKAALTGGYTLLSADYLVWTAGLEDALEISFGELTEPEDYGGGVTFLGAAVDGKTVLLRYQLADAEGLYGEDAVTASICDEVFLRNFLEHGAVFENRYEATNSSVLQTVTVMAEDCTTRVPWAD